MNPVPNKTLDSLLLHCSPPSLFPHYLLPPLFFPPFPSLSPPPPLSSIPSPSPSPPPPSSLFLSLSPLSAPLSPPNPTSTGNFEPTETLFNLCVVVACLCLH